MRRRIFNLLAAISLLLCLATPGLWVRSEFRWDQLFYGSLGSAGASSTTGRVGYRRGLFLYWHVFAQSRHKPVVFRPSVVGWHVFSYALPTRRGYFTSQFRRYGFYVVGFGYLARGGTINGGTRSATFKLRELCVPLWFVMLLLALAPARWAILKRREIRRRPHHLCKNCGYDLRATPDANGPLLDRCPECGSKAHASAPNG